jgi:hypothetical protein
MGKFPLIEVVAEISGVKVRVPVFSDHTEWKEKVSFKSEKGQINIPAHVMNGMVVASNGKKVIVNRHFYVKSYEVGRKNIVFKVVFRKKTLKDGRKFLLIDYVPLGQGVYPEYILKFDQLDPDVEIPGFKRGIKISSLN